MLRKCLAIFAKLPFAVGYAAGRIASADAAQKHWGGVHALLVSRAVAAEARAGAAEAEARRLEAFFSGDRSRMARLEAILQTRNLGGGFFPNGQERL